MVSKAIRYETKTDKIIKTNREVRELYALNRQRVHTTSTADGGSTPSPAGPGAGNYLETKGDTMIGPIAFSPVDVIIDSDGHIKIGQDDRTISTSRLDYSTYVLMTGAGSPDDVNFIDGAAFNGQYLILQGVASQILNIINAQLPAITSISGTTTVSVTTGVDHNLLTGAKVNILGTTNFNVQNVTITVTGATTFTYADAGHATPESAGTVQSGNILTSDGTDIELDGTAFTNSLAVANFIFDVTVAGNGAWRYVGGSGNGGGGGGSEFADNLFTIFDDIDDTRKLQIQVGGIAAATTRTWTAQNADGTVALLDGSVTQTTANDWDFNASVTVHDDAFKIVDEGDSTKQLKFSNTGMATSTNTTLTFAQTLNSVITFPSIGVGTIPYLERAQTWTGLNTFTPDATLASLNVGLKAGADPSAGANGDLYYNTTTNVFRAFKNGSWQNLGEVPTWTVNHDANTFALEDAKFADGVTPSKRVIVDISGAGASTNTTLNFVQSLNSAITFPSISVGTIPYLERAQTWTGVNTFTPDATLSSLNVGSKAGADPSAGANGDMYYNTTTNVFRTFTNGAWADIGEVVQWTVNHDANTFALEDAKFADGTTPSKRVIVDISGASVSTNTTLTFAQTLNSVITFPSISAGTIPYLERAQTWTGVNTFTPDATLSSLNFGSKADPDPTAGANGDVYYNTTNNKFRGFQAGAWTDLIGGGGIPHADGNGATDIIENTTDATKTLRYDLSNMGTGVFTGIASLVSGTSKNITIPNITGTIVLASGTQSIAGAKTFTNATTFDGTASVINVQGTGAYLQMNAHPIEFKTLTVASAGTVGSTERRIFNNSGDNNKMYVKRDDQTAVSIEGYRHGTIPQTANAYFSLQMHGDGAGSNNQTVNSLVAVPFIPAEDCTMTHIGLHIDTVGSANSDIIVGLYTNNPTTDDGNYPSLKIKQTNAIDTTTGGNVTAALQSSQTLAGGVLYWIVLNQENGSSHPLIQNYDGALMTIPNIGILSTDANSFDIASNDQAWGWRVNSTYSTTMPTFPASATKQQQLQNPPAIFVRCTVP